MEWLGLISLALIIPYSGYLNKINKLESKVKKLENKIRGEITMSRILSELINKKCILCSSEAYSLVSKSEINCTILEVDEDWVKINYTNKKGVNKTVIIKVESISKVFIEE